MTEKINTVPKKDAEWKQVSTFGQGIIYAAGEKRKIVTPGLADFKYQVKPELTQQTEIPSTPDKEVPDKVC